MKLIIERTGRDCLENDKCTKHYYLELLINIFENETNEEQIKEKINDIEENIYYSNRKLSKVLQLYRLVCCLSEL